MLAEVGAYREIQSTECQQLLRLWYEGREGTEVCRENFTHSTSRCSLLGPPVPPNHGRRAQPARKQSQRMQAKGNAQATPTLHRRWRAATTQEYVVVWPSHYTTHRAMAAAV